MLEIEELEKVIEKLDRLADENDGRFDQWRMLEVDGRLFDSEVEAIRIAVSVLRGLKSAISQNQSYEEDCWLTDLQIAEYSGYKKCLEDIESCMY